MNSNDFGTYRERVGLEDGDDDGGGANDGNGDGDGDGDNSGFADGASDNIGAGDGAINGRCVCEGDGETSTQTSVSSGE